MGLPGGRVLEYCASGDPAWDLLVFHPGTPLAATDFPHISSAAAAHGIRTAIVSRPGYGASTRHPGRTVADAAADTAALADHLGAESLLVAGWSGGGPPALACAALLGDRVRACLSIAGFAPVVEAGASSAGWPAPAERDARLAVLNRSPQEIAPAAGVAMYAGTSVATLRHDPTTNAADAAAQRELPAAADAVARSLRLGVAAGVWGWVDDEISWSQPWGFDVADIRVPVIVRHGDDDRAVSVREGRWLAEHVPHARFQELPGGGHLSVIAPFEPALTALIAASPGG